MLKRIEINGLTLHIFAMAAMLLDHAWATIVPGNQWMNFVGRLAFPIFAFMAAEGYYYTSDFNKYIKRLLVFAVISEIPFNMMNSGTISFPFHQNVLWTFVIALLAIRWIENIKKGDASSLRKSVVIILVILGAFLIGTATMVDYGGAGILTVIMFYYFRGREPIDFARQAFGLFIINFFILQNMDVPLEIFGLEFFFPTQGFAIFALIPIWFYKGKQGPHNKVIQYVCYGFYPVHILVLSLMAMGGF